MTIYYSDSTKGFYDTDFGYDSYPGDVIEITKEEHASILNALNLQNKKIEIVNGKITLVNNVPTYTWDMIRAKRTRLLTSSDYTQMADWPGDKEAWTLYRQTLRDLPQTYTNAADVAWPAKPGE